MISVLAGSASGQRGTPSAIRLTAGVDTLHIAIVSGRDTTPAGMVVDDLRFVTHAGVPTVVRVYRSTSSVLGNRVDSLVDDMSFRPIVIRSATALARESVNVDSGRATGHATSGGREFQVDLSVPAGVINAASFDLALRGSELELGAEFRFTAVAASMGAMLQLAARVTAIEAVDGVDCWVIEATFAGAQVRFWIARSDRSLRRQVMPLGPGVQLIFTNAPVRPRSSAGRSSE
jgi:hypothetical protein